MKAITIYSVPQVANLTVSGVNSRMHMIIASTYGRSTLRIFRRVQNDLDFLVRDIDRQPVVVDGLLSLVIFDDAGNTLLTKELSVVNAPRGHYKANIEMLETLQLSTGLYNWLVRVTDQFDIDRLLYTNQDYVVRGVVEVNEGLLVPLEEPTVIMGEDLTPSAQFFYSDAISAFNPNNLVGTHSLVAHLNEFTGTIWVDIALDDSTPTNEADWIEIVAREFEESSTGSFVIPFNGNYNFVRFRTTSNDGITKLVYRN